MIKGVIFDMDGVISDTQNLHASVESELLARFGIVISPDEISRRYAGRRTIEFFDELLKKQNKPYDLTALMLEKWTRITGLVHKAKAVEGSVKLIQLLHKNKFPLAVASASDSKYVNGVLEELGVKKYFTAIIGGDMVSRGKPDPEIFLKAAHEININPTECLVIEDGVSGMLAAKKGNMKCIGLVTDKAGDYPTQNLVLGLNEVTLKYIKNLS